MWTYIFQENVKLKFNALFTAASLSSSSVGGALVADDILACRHVVLALSQIYENKFFVIECINYIIYLLANAAQ